MDKHEELLNEASEKNIEVITRQFSSRIKGLYCDGVIALSDQIDTTAERTCILAEEIGHYETSVGDITGKTSDCTKQERKARIWAYEKLIGLDGIINAYRAGCKSIFDTASFLSVSEEFLCDSLQIYHEKYGICTNHKNYVIYFEPTLMVLELI